MAQLSELKFEESGKVSKEIKKLSPTEHEEELRSLELQAKKLELLEREANLQDVRERLAERELKRSNSIQKSKTNGQTLRQLASIDKNIQAHCNHRKGGTNIQAIINGKGNDPFYAVIKHKFGNGDVWIRCQRCGKTWKPPIKARFIAPADYNAAMDEYNIAKEFNTNNTESGSVIFQYSDGGEIYREFTEFSTLR